MAADVSSLVQILGRYKEDGEGEPKAGSLVTRDLLGGSTAPANNDLQLDLKVPAGWEKRLDLMSGQAYCEPPPPTTTADLNLPPLLPTVTPPPNLDLKLFPPSITTNIHHSVCTLDKVKSALERAAKKKAHDKPAERSLSPTSSSTTTTATTNNSKIAGRSWQGEGDVVEKPRSSAPEGQASGEPTALMAAGCPTCLSYVLVSNRNPRCPRCSSDVPLPVRKKPRIDLDLNSDTMIGPYGISTDAQL